MNEDWQSPKFRQSVIAKINEIVQNTNDPSKNAGVMESHIFKKARSREEYLGLVAKLFCHFKDISNRKPVQQQHQGTDVSNANASMMQDPINALTNLASQGTRNPQMMPMSGQPNQMASGAPVQGNASNLLQTLNQQRPGQQQMQSLQSRGQINVPMGNVPQSNTGPNSMAQMAGNMGSINPGMNINMNAMGNQPNQMSTQMGIPVQINPMAANQMQINPNMQGQPMNTLNVPQLSMNSNISQNQINISLNHPQINQMMTRMNNNPNLPNVPNAVQNQNPMQNQLNVPANMPSMPNQSQIHQNTVSAGPPIGMPQNPGQINPTGNLNQIISMQQQKQNIPMGQPGNMFQVNRSVGQAQFLPQSPSPTVSSPAGMNQQQQQQAQLPNQQMIPSPALVPSSSPQMSNIMPSNQRGMRQSPNAPLNTPGQAAASSPFNPQDDHLYREKYKQLTKYIEPLRRMVARIGNDDVDKISKMNKLLEILCNPQQRISLETLLKCEKALEKMDFKSFPPSSSGSFGTSNPLLEVLNTTLQSPLANHTLYRTFHPSLESFFGSDINLEPQPEKKPRLSKKEATQIPHLLQGEIARLHPKFKVAIDPSSQLLNETITLTCYLDDRKLPLVPPIYITIPADYPFATPTCTLTDHEYSATKFLIAVQKALTTRISKFTITYTLSHLLDTWEMSVRQACSPNETEPSKIGMIYGI